MTYKEAFMNQIALMANVAIITTVVYQTWRLNRWMESR